MLQLIDWERLIIRKDGDTYFVITADFVDLQESPAVPLSEEQAKVISPWYGKVPCPILHLPIIDIMDIIREYNKQLENKRFPKEER